MRALVLVAAALLSAGCGAGDRAAEPAEQPASAPAAPAADPIAGETLEGESLALAQLEGRLVVVNVWSSW